MLTETITWRPADAALPDPESNVLLAMADGTTCEGFLDTEPDRNLWRDVCAVEIAGVTHWADLPKGPVAC